MAEATSLPSSGLRVTHGFSSLFNQSIRRSRSLANLQKEASENPRSQSSLSVHREEPEPDQVRPKPRAVKTNPSDGEIRQSNKRKILTPTVSSNSVFTLSTRPKEGMRTPSPPARPAPAPRLWDDDNIKSPPLSHKASLAGMETSVAPNDANPLSSNPPSGSPYTNSSRTSSPSSSSPRSRTSPRPSRERSLAHRRKHSVSELAIEPMSTVKEQFESPIPEEQSAQNLPGNAKMTPLDSLTPKSHEFLESDLKLDEFMDDLETPVANSHKSYRRSSMLLPGMLAPLLIPNTPSKIPPPFDLDNMVLPATTYGMKSPVELSASPIDKPGVQGEDKPPKVPPKSPRTLNRARPAHLPPLATAPATATATATTITTTAPVTTPAPTTATAATTTATTAQSVPLQTTSASVPSTHPPKSPTSSALPASQTTSSSVSGSPSELPAGSMLWSPRQPQDSSSIQANRISLSAPALVASPLPWSMGNLQPTSPHKPMHNQNNFSIDDTVSKNLLMEKATPHHQRNASDSVINRGRPMKKSEIITQRTISRGLKLATIDNTINQLPTGFSRTSVVALLSPDELLTLQQNAEFQAAGYEALPNQSVEDLTKELSLLEDHCVTLRRTAASLRASRKALHERLIAFLNAPGNAFVSREHVVKQSSSLGDLDASIDDYTTKLETAHERRTKVQRKLLEHCCAVLSLRIPAGHTTGEEQTPPRSPVSASDAEHFERLSYTMQVQALQEQRKRESEERRERLRQIEKMEREQEELEGEFRSRQASSTTDTGDSPRNSTQTIQIYADKGLASLADGGVAGLLASIEKEIDAMDRMRNS